MNTGAGALRSLVVPSRDTKRLRWSDYFDALRRRWWLIAVITLAASLITLAVALAQTPIYQAESRLQVSPGGDASVFQSVGPQNSADAQRSVETQAQIIESERVRARVMVDLKIEVVPPPAHAVVVDDSNIIAVRVLSADPGTAQILANQYVTAYIELRREAATSELIAASKEIQNKITDVQGQIDGLLPEDPQVPSLVAQLGAFRQALNQLQIDTSLKTSGVAVVQKASLPSTPVAPRPVHDTLLAALIGFVAGVLLVLLLERLNRAVRSDRDLGRISDLPIFADVPNAQPRDNRPVSLSDPGVGAAESYRGLRSTFLHLAARDDAKMIVVTSSVGDEGKTTTAANLAVVLAQAGKKVVLVDADLRQPHQHLVFGTTVEPGLVDLLTWQHDEQAMRRLDLGDGAELMLIPAGSVPLGSSELLGSDRGTEIFEEMRRTFDHVIIDSAPILPVADTMALGALADATVLVVRSTRTSRTTVRTALSRLARIDANVIGFVLNRVPGRFMPGGVDRYGMYGLSDLGAAPPVLVEGPDADQFTDGAGYGDDGYGADGVANDYTTEYTGEYDVYTESAYAPDAAASGPASDSFSRTAYGTTDDDEGRTDYFARTDYAAPVFGADAAFAPADDDTSEYATGNFEGDADEFDESDESDAAGYGSDGDGTAELTVSETTVEYELDEAVVADDADTGAPITTELPVVDTDDYDAADEYNADDSVDTTPAYGAAAVWGEPNGLDDELDDEFDDELDDEFDELADDASGEVTASAVYFESEAVSGGEVASGIGEDLSDGSTADIPMSAATAALMAQGSSSEQLVMADFDDEDTQPLERPVAAADDLTDHTPDETEEERLWAPNEQNDFPTG